MSKSFYRLGNEYRFSFTFKLFNFPFCVCAIFWHRLSWRRKMLENNIKPYHIFITLFHVFFYLCCRRLHHYRTFVQKNYVSDTIFLPLLRYSFRNKLSLCVYGCTCHWCLAYNTDWKEHTRRENVQINFN